MALVDEESPLGSRSELALFDVPPTQVAVVRGFVEEVQLAIRAQAMGLGNFVFHLMLICLIFVIIMYIYNLR